MAGCERKIEPKMLLFLELVGARLRFKIIADLFAFVI